MQRDTELGPLSPGAVAHAEGVDRDQLVPDADGAGVVARLVEVALGQVVGRADRFILEPDLDLGIVGVEVVHFVPRERLEAAVADAVGQLEIGAVCVLRQGQVPEVLGVDAVPHLVARRVPQSG